MRWGLVPSWSKEISNRYATFNARIESIESKPAFRNAWRRNQKCLIPALGYYEWQKESDGKQPYFVTSKEQGPLMFAGLWDECQFDDASLKSCTIITTESEQHLKDLHSRMPVMLDVDGAKQWLSSDDGKDVLLSECRADVEIYKVDRRVNNAREEDEGLITCVD
jgi:putative SOS response-associated peptidase YedK